MKTKMSLWGSLQRYFLAGVLTVIPVLVTWFLVDFFLDLLRSFGEPVVRFVSNSVQPILPGISAWLTRPWFQAILAVILVVSLLILAGWLATLYIGRRFLGFFDSLMHRVPMVRSIYGSVKKLLDVIQTRPEGVQRVVLIDFPSPEMKTLGLVTRTMEDENTGQKLATVYVPTTPNPTSGYLEIVPVENLTSTDWTFDEAMAFIISGGASGPETMVFDKVSGEESEEKETAREESRIGPRK